MTQHGDPYENAVAERINSILKTDFRLNRVFTTFDEAARAVKQCVRNYNHLRPHMSCGYLTPAAVPTHPAFPVPPAAGSSTASAGRNAPIVPAVYPPASPAAAPVPTAPGPARRTPPRHANAQSCAPGGKRSVPARAPAGHAGAKTGRLANEKTAAETGRPHIPAPAQQLAVRLERRH